MTALENANCSVLGASFDSVADQKKFADDQNFPYPLLSDPDKVMGSAYDAVRSEGEKYFEAGIPRRISYLISPDGKIAKAYDVENDKLDLAGHAEAILADIHASS